MAESLLNVKKRPFSGPTANNEEVNYDSSRLDFEKLDESVDMDNYILPVGSLSEPSTSRGIVCVPCNLTFSNKSNLRRHEKRIHSKEDDSNFNQVCGICNSKLRTISDLHNHIEVTHPDLKLNFQNEIFYSGADFEKWKMDIERETVSSFILSFTKVIDEITKVLYYKCHRSGAPKTTHKSDFDRKRRSKFSGTIKTGITCPAVIKVTQEMVDEATEISVTYQSTHVGHKCEVGKLPLQKEERKKIANMLRTGIPISVVMDKTHAQFSPTKRIGLTTPQDVYNIAQDYDILETVHKNDLMAVDITVRKMMLEDYNSVLVYKPKGEMLDGYPNIARNSLSENIEKEIILQQVHKKPRMDINDVKLSIDQLWQDISREIHSSKSLEHVQHAKETLKNLQRYFELSKRPILKTSKISNSIPPNKKVSLQRKNPKSKQKKERKLKK